MCHTLRLKLFSYLTLFFNIRANEELRVAAQRMFFLYLAHFKCIMISEQFFCASHSSMVITISFVARQDKNKKQSIGGRISSKMLEKYSYEIKCSSLANIHQNVLRSDNFFCPRKLQHHMTPFHSAFGVIVVFTALSLCIITYMPLR